MCKSSQAGPKQGQEDKSSKSRKKFLATRTIFLADLCTCNYVTYVNDISGYEMNVLPYSCDQAL